MRSSGAPCYFCDYAYLPGTLRQLAVERLLPSGLCELKTRFLLSSVSGCVAGRKGSQIRKQLWATKTSSLNTTRQASSSIFPLLACNL